MANEIQTPKKHEIRKVRESLEPLMDACVTIGWKIPQSSTKLQMISTREELRDLYMYQLLEQAGDAKVNLNCLFAEKMFLKICQDRGYFDVEEYYEQVMNFLEEWKNL